MKFVIYKGQSKFTIDNVSLPDSNTFYNLEQESRDETMTVNELDLCNFRITSTRSMFEFADLLPESFGQEEEWEDGINCRQETVN